MKHTYSIDGMTCMGCVANVTETLSRVKDIKDVQVNLEKKEAKIEMSKHVSLSTLKRELPDKYTISENEDQKPTQVLDGSAEKSKLQQLKPLFIILGYILIASILMHRNDWDMGEMMIDFMGLFFIVFSFFKMLDIQGFASTFSMYDPIANLIPPYARVYPFIETLLGLMFLLRFNLILALILTIIILGFTTYGVTKTLLSKRTIKCACLGTALDLPMTEATFIENSLMIVMAIWVLIMI